MSQDSPFGRFEVLVEGASDVPTVREIFKRRFGLVEQEHFRLHPHRGKGDLPNPVNKTPDPWQQTLLHQLPAKLRGWAHQGSRVCVVVLVDADNENPSELLARLENMLAVLERKPPRVLFRLAVEETESWFIADVNALKTAYPKVRLKPLAKISPDSIVGAWELLAKALGLEKDQVSGADKHAWAERIAPHLELDAPCSPSLRAFIEGVEGHLLAPNSAPQSLN